MAESAPAYFVSDLHLFSRRSNGDRHAAAIHERARVAREFVLGGDLFDFRWTTRPTISDAVRHAARWLEHLAAENPHCRFHVLLGNHDHRRDYCDQLDKLSRRRENFAWQPFVLRMGKAVFLHGDAADRGATPNRLTERRSHAEHHRKKGRLANLMYDVAISGRLHNVVARAANRRRKVARRISAYLDAVGHGRESGVEHVYFGHTHVPLTDFQHGGLTFHNPGATIKGVGFRIVPVKGSQDEAERPTRSTTPVTASLQARSASK